MRRIVASVALAAVITLWAAAPALADFGDRSSTQASEDGQSVDGLIAIPGSSGGGGNPTEHSASGSATGPQRPTGTKSKPPTKAQIAAYDKAVRAYAAALAVCRTELSLYGEPGLTAADCVAKVGPGPTALVGVPADPKAAPPPPPDPAVLAQIAVTRLRIPDPKAMIGPPPEINQWKRAFVGYPLWLWNGETNQVTTAVTLEGVTLTLTARRQATRFDMGERGAAPVYCVTGTPWTRAVTPGTESPTCGYRYTQASMTKAAPNGAYTVTATSRWEVTWTALGQTGTIPLQATATTQLPVGELQTVRRR